MQRRVYARGVGGVVSSRMANAMRLLAFALLASCAPWAHGDDATIRWQRPGHFFPVLGWREPVGASAAWELDRYLAAIPADRYNCHFYTKAYIEWRADADAFWDYLGHARDDLLTEEFLAAWGYERVAQPGAMAGDVIVSGRRDARGRCSFTHSAIVADVDAAGAIRRIRQKFDPTQPIVDVTLDEFVMLYAGLHPWETQVWRKAPVSWDAAGHALASAAR